MPEKEYKAVCANCGISIETKQLRVLRFSKEDKRKWNELVARINSGRGRFWGILSPLLIVLILLVAMFPIIPLSLDNPREHSYVNPLYPSSFNLAKKASDFFFGSLIQEGEWRLIMFPFLVGVLFDCFYIPLAVRHLKKLRRKKAEILGKYDFLEGEEDYAVEEECA